MSEPRFVLPRFLGRLESAGAIVLLAALASSSAVASQLRYLARDEVLCDSKRLACIKGTLSYEANTRLLELYGRVQFTTVAGVLTITVKGSNRLGHVRYAPMEIQLRGRESEVVDFRMIPDYPDVDNWVVDHIVYLPADCAPAADCVHRSALTRDARTAMDSYWFDPAFCAVIAWFPPGPAA